MAAADKHEKFMRAALREARKGVGHTSPNPAVGALLVSKGRIVGRGHHRGAGRPHAEVECLQRFNRRVPRDAILYVTLEPCSTVGRTGACTEAIVRAGVGQVVIGAIDPNPKHNGQGLTKLRAAGIDVVVGVLADECTALNEGFNKWIATGRPFVIAKCGMTLDGRLTLPARTGRWITSAAARRDAQQLRRAVDAILVGGETARRDNPRLTTRPAGGRQPWRVVLTRSGKLSRQSHLLRDRFKERTLVYRNKTLSSVLRDLGKKEVLSLLVEGGGDILGHFLDKELIDKMQIYVAPVLAGGPVLAFAGSGAAATVEALKLENVFYQRIGHDVRVIGYARKMTSE